MLNHQRVQTQNLSEVSRLEVKTVDFSRMSEDAQKGAKDEVALLCTTQLSAPLRPGENLGPLQMLNHRSQGDAWRIRTSLLTTMHFLRHSENGAEMCPNKLQNVRSSYWAVADWP